MTRSLIAMSGGVDSSVAAYLIKEMGHETFGITLKLFDNEDAGLCRENTCCSLSDVQDAQSVCYRLGIPHYVFNFTSRFREEVIDRFIRAYETGATPNPCIDCNRYIKFSELMERSHQLDCDYVVTGHYVKREFDQSSGRYLLKKGEDATKDQSYVLYSMTQKQLARTLFPLGEYRKTTIREIAEEQDFLNAKKKESQDICFVIDGNYADFIQNYTGKTYPPGLILNTKGEKLGNHEGLIHYTIGQRKGLGIAAGEPVFVCRKDMEKNQLVVGPHEELFGRSLDADNINLIACEKIDRPLRVKAKIRYSQKEHPATVEQTDETRIHLEFDEPQRAITKGQAVVLYDDNIVVGGGTIV